MSLLFSIILWAIYAVLVLLAVVLVTPMKFRLHLANTTQPSYRLDVRVAGGLAPQITLVQGPQLGPKSARKAKKKSSKRRRKSRDKPFCGSIGRALPRLLGDFSPYSCVRALC
tara:strand:+ start:1205 stop:1543 length:339 start_codon:yes stop_codon:yes gene_type:complete